MKNLYKMIMIGIILTSFSITNSQNYQFDIMSKYYNVSNNVLKCIVIDDNEYIFYGDNGGVLRTYDGGETWHQKFIGTHNFINEMKFIDEILYGVTSGGEVIISEDKGENWNLIRVSNENINNITLLEDDIYIITNSREIFISTNSGNEWNKIYTFNFDVIQFEHFENQLFVRIQNDNFVNILFSQNKGLDWSELNLPHSEFRNRWLKFKKLQDNFVVHNDVSFAELNEDLTWDYFNLNEQVVYDLVKINNEYTIINYHPDSLDIYFYKYSKEERKIIDSITHSKIGIMPGDYRIISTASDSENILLTSYNKTILKCFNDNTKIDVLSSFAKYGTTIPVFIDKDNWNYSTSLLGNGKGGNIIKTTNGGKTFNFSHHFFLDTITSEVLGYGLPQIYSFSSDTIILNIVRDVIGQTGYNHLPNSNYISFNNGKDIIKLDSLSDLTAGEFKKIIKKTGSKFIILKNNRLESKLEFYLMNENYDLEKISEINEINNFDFVKYYLDGDDIYICGFSNVREKRHFVYKTSDNCQNWELVFGDTFNGYTTISSFFKSKNGKFYMILGNQDNKIVEFDKLDGFNEYIYIYDAFSFGDEKLFRFFETSSYFYENNIQYIEDIEFIHGFAIQVNMQYIGYYFDVKLNVKDNEIIVDTLKSFDKKYIKINSKLDNSHIYYLNNFNIFIPIEDTTLIKSVEKIKPPSIWTYPPYPNPVKDRLKMQFYSAMMSEIAKLKVELIHIGTGRSYQIDQYDLNVKDDYWGEIEIDVSGYIRGAYLINFKLGDGNKSESIIIE